MNTHDEEIAKRLADFGLTFNQALVYLSIVQSKTTSVNRIAQDTKLYRQDIYKMMPKLQKMGLVAKIFGKPAKFEALPIEIALGNLLAIKRKETEGRILRLSANMNTLTEELRQHQARRISQQEEPNFSLLTTDLEIGNRFDAAFENARKEFSVVTTPELAPLVVSKIREQTSALAGRGIRTRVIIDSSADADTKNLLEKLDPTNKFLISKQVSDANLLPYRIFDDREVLIIITRGDKSGLPYFLWTDAPDIVKFYRKNFERLWKSPAAKPL